MLLTITLLLSGCDPRAGKYPHSRSEQWYSEDPQISLHYIKDENNNWLILETLIWEGKEREISIGMQSSYFCVYPADSTRHDDRLFSGRWYCRWGNLVLVLEEDFIFGGKYSKIVLSPVAPEDP